MNPEETIQFKKDVEEWKESTQDFVTLTKAQLEHMRAVQEGHHETLFGSIPPDPEKPGMVIEHRENTKIAKGFKRATWLLAGGFLTACGGSVWVALAVFGG